MPFEIQHDQERLELEPGGRGTATFTVTSEEAATVRLGVKVDERHAGWFSLEGEAIRRFTANASDQVQVSLHVPPDTPPATVSFTLTAGDDDRPSEDYADGPPIRLTVTAAAAPAPERPSRWWVWLVVAAVLLIGGGLAWCFTLGPCAGGPGHGEACASEAPHCDGELLACSKGVCLGAVGFTGCTHGPADCISGLCENGRCVARPADPCAGVVCTFPHGRSACVDGRCVRQRCDLGWHDLDGAAANGCEYRCRPGGEERCDGIDNDCDGSTDEGVVAAEVCNDRDDDCDRRIDEGFDLGNDPSNCGRCGRRCHLANASAKCVGGECRVDHCLAAFVDRDGDPANGCEYGCQPSRGGREACDQIDNDCDGSTDEGFDLSRDPNNCGRCGEVCKTDTNREVSCVAGKCELGACRRGFTDPGGDGMCEYRCIARGSESCNGEDDDCDGKVDEATNCGDYIQKHCEVRIGWADFEKGPRTPQATWPCTDEHARCTATKSTGGFGRIDFTGNVDRNDDIGVAFVCADRANPRLAAYIQSHCALYFGQADVEHLPDRSLEWGPCSRDVGREYGSDPHRGKVCTSSGYDGLYHKMTLLGDVKGDDQFGFAWICRDPADPKRAEALQASAAVYVGWADLRKGPKDGNLTWLRCPRMPRDTATDLACVGTQGDGRFHVLKVTGDVDGNDQMGFALTRHPWRQIPSRPPRPLGRSPR